MTRFQLRCIGDYMPTSKPESFIANSDFATLKNDAIGDVTVTFPGAQNLAADEVRSYTATIELGIKGASLRSRLASSKDSNRYYACSSIDLPRTGTVFGMPASYSIIASLSRTSSTTVTVFAVVMNPYFDVLTTEGVDETFSFELSSFLPPFA